MATTAPPAPPAAAPARKDALPSVTGIDRIPIPDASPAVVQAAKMDRAKPAGFWIRLAAWFVDCIPAFLITGISLALTFFVSHVLGQLFNLLSIAYCAYDFVVLPALKSSTIGMKVLGLQIVHPSARPGEGLGWSVALIRLVGHIVCFPFTLGVGYLLIAFTSQKQGLHDMIAGTRVVRVR
jgi:uncharacterized RDD family membrane protein YckC